MLEINCPSCLSSNILEDREVARDIECMSCGCTFFVEMLSEEEPLEEEPLAQDNAQDFNQIIITTGPPPFEYEILDTIVILETLDENFFQNNDPSIAFDVVKEKLKKQALSKRANAIINCHFDYRISAGHGIFGKNHDLEIFAYGTLVKK